MPIIPGINPDGTFESAAVKAGISKKVADDITAGNTPVATALNAASVQALEEGGAARPVVESAIANTRGLTVAQDVARKLRGKKVAVVLRHDDVQKSALDYLPVYAARNVQASWYVAVNQMGGIGTGGSQNATAADIQNIHAQGHEIGSHTMDHFYMNSSTEEQRRAQLEDAKIALEELLGGGYVCETFAYPGNEALNHYEVLDYYLMATSGVNTVNIAGTTNTAETVDLSAHRAEYPNPIIGATPAETTTKAQAWFDAQKSRPGVTVFTLQTHNTNELSVPQLEALLDVIEADPEVTTLTMREVAHYIREYNTTEDGRIYHGQTYTGGSESRFVGTIHAAAGKVIDRLGLGRALRVRVNGAEVATLDDELHIMNPGISMLEKGHQLRFYSSGNEYNGTIDMKAGGQFDFTTTAGGFLRFLQRLQIRFTGKAIEAINTSSGLATFDVDTARGTVYLRPLTELPTGMPRVGEMCVVGTDLYIATQASTQASAWVKVGTQA